MEHSKLQGILLTVFDKRLYGLQFFLISGPPLAVGLAIEVSIYYALKSPLLLSYVFVFLALVLICGIGSKNFGREREVPNMGYFRSFLFLIVSVLAVTFPFLAHFSNNLYGFFDFLLTYTISVLALTVAVVEVTILGQRTSLRKSIHLDVEFFKKQRAIWEERLQSFPNSEKILDRIDDSKYVSDFFDRGSFNLAILWSCSIMEEIIDATTKRIIKRDPTKEPLFRKEKGERQPYPLQLRNLNFIYHPKSTRKSEEMSIDDLWVKERPQIAHHEHRPSFDETFGALAIFVSFIEEFPKKLEAWE